MKHNIYKLLDSIKNIEVDDLPLDERVDIFNILSDLGKEIVGINHPVLNVKLISCAHVKNNDYNPNTVALPEYRLLKHSIKKDGFTMPVVVGEKDSDNSHVIIDGYHRTQLSKQDLDINASLANYLPVVILNKKSADRISSSIRHNMARGTHQVELTSQLVIKLKNLEWNNNEIGIELGMDNDEILRMQQISGLADAFKSTSFSMAWK